MASNRDIIRIGTRGSRLALIQAERVIEKLKGGFPELGFETVIIKTKGDKDKTSPLVDIGGIGLFTKAIEDALLEKSIDIAVHSAKDLPSDIDAKFEIPAVLERGSVEDVLLTRDGRPLDMLREGALIGSSSPRRISQLLHLKQDLRFADIRGNMDTRIKKLKTGAYDGIISAKAAVERIDIDKSTYSIIPKNLCLPAAGQGIICMECLRDNSEISELLKKINHLTTFQRLKAERSFLRELDIGCGLPVAVLSEIDGGRMKIIGRVLDAGGKRIAEETVFGKRDKAEELGKQLGKKILPQANELLGR